MFKENKKVIVDTGFFISLFSPRDKHHNSALKLAKKHKERNWITTWPVITETCHMIPSEKINEFIACGCEGAFECFSLDAHCPFVYFVPIVPFVPP